MRGLRDDLLPVLAMLPRLRVRGGDSSVTHRRLETGDRIDGAPPMSR